MLCSGITSDNYLLLVYSYCYFIDAPNTVTLAQNTSHAFCDSKLVSEQFDSPTKQFVVSQWRRNEFESGGRGTGPARSAEKFF